ncbi:MAG: hypothetical protein WAL72_18330 [Streptosporangiaceae bacterium]
MVTFTELAPAPADPPEPFPDRLRLAVAAYLARFKGPSREHTESDLRCYLSWCAERGLDPLAAQRPHLELYIRWMQEIRRFKPSTTSRRFSVTAGFYRSSVIDGVMQPSPVEHVRRPGVPAESPTLGFTHLQFEALLTASRESPNPSDFVLLAAGAAAVITLSWLVPYPVVAATNSQGAARVTPRLVDLVAALAAGRWARPWPAPPIARRRRASRRYASACSGSRPTCGPLPSTPTTLCSAASGAIAWAAILKFVRCARVVVGSLRRSSALPPSAIMIRMLSLLTRSSG